MTHFPQIDALPDAIFWDWDGTIVNSYNMLSETHNYTLRKLGMNELKKGEFKDYFGKERMFIFSSIYGDNMERAAEIFQKRVMVNSHMIKPMDGVIEVLDFLKIRGVVLGLVTNKRRCFVEKELEHTGFKEFLPIVVCAGEAQQDKPYPDPLLMALENAGLSLLKHRIWYVGDTETDLKCAAKARCESVFIKGHKDTISLIDKYTPFISFDNYHAFKDFLVAI